MQLTGILKFQRQTTGVFVVWMCGLLIGTTGCSKQATVEQRDSGEGSAVATEATLTEASSEADATVIVC